MSRGPGRTQIEIFKALCLSTLACGAVIGEDGNIWHGMAGLAEDLRRGNLDLDRATIRRAIRSMERAGYVEVHRDRVLVDSDGMQIGHAQNVVRLTDRGHEYLARRVPRSVPVPSAGSDRDS